MLLKYPTSYTSETRASMMLRKEIKETGHSKGKEGQKEGKAQGTSNAASHLGRWWRKCWFCWWRCFTIGHENGCLAWGTAS